MKKLILLSMTFLLAFGIGVAFAAGAAPGGSWWDTWSLQVYHAINLLIFIGIIVKLAGPGIVEALKNRSDTIASEIVEAKRLHEEAQALLSEYDSRLASLESEAKTILDDYRNMGEQERDRIINQAQVEADRIRSESVKVAESEFARAKERIEFEVVDKAINAATQVIVEKLTDEEHARLTSDYFVELESSLENMSQSEA